MDILIWTLAVCLTVLSLPLAFMFGCVWTYWIAVFFELVGKWFKRLKRH